MEPLTSRPALSPMGWFIVGLVALDLVTKIAALRFLGPDGVHDLAGDGWLVLLLAINRTGMGSAYRTLSAGNQALGIAASAAHFLVAAAVIHMRQAAWPAWMKVGAGVLAYFLLSWAAGLVGTTMEVKGIPMPVFGLACRIGTLALELVLFGTVKTPELRLVFAFFVAAGAGNSLSFLYPPFAVIDFVYCEPLERTLGIGVFNLADVYHGIFLVALLPALIVRILRGRSRSSPVRRRAPSALAISRRSRPSRRSWSRLWRVRAGTGSSRTCWSISCARS